MKMLVLGYDDYFDTPITDAFKVAGCKSYLRLHKGTRPSGKANAVFVPLSEEELPGLLEILRGLKAQYPTVDLRAFTFPLEECVL